MQCPLPDRKESSHRRSDGAGASALHEQVVRLLRIAGQDTERDLCYTVSRQSGALQREGSIKKAMTIAAAAARPMYRFLVFIVLLLFSRQDFLWAARS